MKYEMSDEMITQVEDLRKRAEIRRKIRPEGDRLAKQLDDAADTIMNLLQQLYECQVK